jgi:D-alanine-D-alanine ligase-like ATP-grasp enzyme
LSFAMLESHDTTTAHYPFVTRMLIDLFAKGELPRVKEISIEPMYGHVGRIVYHAGAVHMFRSTNLGVNPLGASEIAKDKGYTQHFLRGLGYKTPRGETFLHPDYLKSISKNISSEAFRHAKSMEQAAAVVATSFGYPCYVKPNFGSQGRGIRKCEHENDLETALQDLKEEKIKLCIIEEALSMPDYRVVVFHDEIISCYLRIPLFVEGDGILDIHHLLQKKQEAYLIRGRDTSINVEDPRIVCKLQREGLSFDTILKQGEQLTLLDISNLSAGGESLEYSDCIHTSWKQLCIEITAAMGLKLCGVDIACTDLEDPSAAYRILELNAAPGLDHYAASGETQAQIVRSLYQRIFNGIA